MESRKLIGAALSSGLKLSNFTVPSVEVKSYLF